jgi:hypothetical protein
LQNYWVNQVKLSKPETFMSLLAADPIALQARPGARATCRLDVAAILVRAAA